MQAKATHLLFGYAADPCGSGLSRYLTKKDDDCWVVAPSLMPKKAGDRVKTNRRDAVPRARLARAGDRTAVSVPTGEEAAMRDLTRAREETLSDCQDAQLRLQAFLLRHAIRSTGQAPGGPAPLRWRSEGVCPPPAPPIVFHASVRAVPEHPERLQRLDPDRHAHVPAWRVPAVVEALQALRGVPCTVAVTMVAALGDLTRFATPRDRMPCLGLIPAASSSGARRHQGSITQAGNPHARQALVAGVWASREPAKVRRHVPRRLEKQPTMMQDIRGQVRVRLGQRSRHLVARGTHAPSVIVALARALAGCRWAMAQQLPVAASAYKDR